MKKDKSKIRLLGKQAWCVICIDKNPKTIKKADFLIPVRIGHYDRLPDDSDIDNRVMGVCEECLKHRNEFQKNNHSPVNLDHKHLVYKNI